MQQVRVWVSGVALAMGIAVGCGGSTRSSAPEGDAGTGVDAQAGSPACAALASCCKSPRINDSASCVASAQSGVLSNAACAMELSIYESNGLCAADAGTSKPVDGGPFPGRDGSTKPDTSFFGHDASPQDVFISPQDAVVFPHDAVVFPQDVYIPPFSEAGYDSSVPATTACSPACVSPQTCIALPGIDATCGTACASDSDCPGLMTCGGGSCTYACTTCPAGQQCQEIGMPGRQCTSNSDCGVGLFCDDEGPFSMCQGYQACVACTGECPKCLTNAQCAAGLVCENEACVACTSNSQCGATGTCGATHTGMECTCTVDGDCATGESCQTGVCAVNGAVGCADGFNQCETGQACVNNVCTTCTSFADCNAFTFGPFGPSGLACISGKCTACTANSQCGGGMACVTGTCGTCSTNTQCGGSGQCTDGFCTCTDTSQCASGQRCGAGVCVTN